jgi:Mrp family chromosome partitioning ATPase/capsular polysaccharide biosynthesis protein
MADQSGTSGDLRDTLAPILRRKWLVAVIVALVTATAYLYYANEPKQYETSARVFVGETATDQAIAGNESIDPTRNTNNLAQLITSRRVSQQVALDLARRGVRPRKVSAAPVEETDFIEITAEAYNAEAAAATANAYAAEFLRYRSRQIRSEARLAREVAERELASLPRTDVTAVSRRALRSQIQRYRAIETLPVGRAELIDPAVPPLEATGPDVVRIAVFAFFLSLLAGISLAYVLERLDRRIRGAHEVERLVGAPLLTVVPHSTRLARATPGDALPPDVVESFRTLRTNIQIAGSHRPVRVLLVTSAVAGEGKSTVAVNLALAFREYGARVALVEADLRRPTLRERLALAPGPGLTEYLAGVVGAEEIRQPQSAERRLYAPVAAVGQSKPAVQAPERPADRGGSLDALPAGAVPADPLALLRGERFADLFAGLRDEYDYVIVDSPPLMSVSDAMPLAKVVDGVVLVVRVDLASRKGVTRAVELLRRSAGEDAIVGAVAADAEVRDVAEGYGGYY